MPITVRTAGNFTLNENNERAIGITKSSFGGYYVLDRDSRKAFHYTSSLQYDADNNNDFDFANVQGVPTGIVRVGDWYYVVDADRVVSYNLGGIYHSANSFDIDNSSTVEGVTRGTGDFNLASGNSDLRGFCWHDGYWRALDDRDFLIYSYNLDGTTTGAPSTISLPSGTGFPNGITSDGTSMYVLDNGTTKKIQVRNFSGTWTSHTITPPTGISNLTEVQSVAYDEDDEVLWIGWQAASGTTNRGAIGSYTKTGSYRANTGFQLASTQRIPNSMVWYNGYLITTDKDDGRFYVYETDGNYISGISNTVSSRVEGMGKRHDRLYLADRSNNGVDVWDIGLAGHSKGITSANGRFYIVSENGVLAYDTSGNRQSDYDWDLADDNSNPEGISFEDDRFFIPDSDNHIYVYDEDGNHIPEEQFDFGTFSSRGIDIDNGNISLLSHTAVRGYSYTDPDTDYWERTPENDISIDFNVQGICIGTDDKIFAAHGSGITQAYNPDGTRSSNDDFTLNNTLKGLTYHEGDFYWVRADTVWRRRGAANTERFSLESENNDPSGIFIRGNRIYVSDKTDNEIFAYTFNGAHQSTENIDLNDNNEACEDIALVNDHIISLDDDDEKIYVYDSNGSHNSTRDLETSGNIDFAITGKDEQVYIFDDTHNNLRSYNFDPYVPVDRTIPSRYNILGRIERMLASAYDILGRITGTTSSGYNILDRIMRTVTAGYDIDERLSRTVTSGYDILTSIAGTIASAFKIKEKTKRVLVMNVNDGFAQAYTFDGTTLSRDSIADTAEITAGGGLVGNGYGLIGINLTGPAIFYDREGTEINRFTPSSLNTPRQGGTIINGILYLVNAGSSRAVFSYDLDGNHIGNFTISVGNPRGIVGIDGLLYIVVTGSGVLHAFTTDGTRSTSNDITLSDSVTNIRGIAYSGEHIILFDAATLAINVYEKDGTFVTGHGANINSQGVAVQNYYPIAVHESQYDILARREGTIASQYTILGRISKTFTAGYDILTSLAGTVLSQYGILERRSRNILSGYDILSTLGVVMSFISAFNLEARRTGTITSQYGIIERIARDMVSQYGIVGRLARTVSSGYNVIKRAAASIASQYGIIGRVSRDTVSGYGILERVMGTIASTYNISSLLAIVKSFMSSFNIEARREGTVTSQYGIRGRIAATIQSGYGVLERLSGTITSGYGIFGRAEKTISSGYGLIGRAAGTVSSAFRIREKTKRIILINTDDDTAMAYTFNGTTISRDEVADVPNIPANGGLVADGYNLIGISTTDDTILYDREGTETSRFTPHASNRPRQGGTILNRTLYIVNAGASRAVYSYDLDGNNLDNFPINVGNPRGIVAINGLLYVIVLNSNTLHAFTPDGTRSDSDDITLVGDLGTIRGVGYDRGHIITFNSTIGQMRIYDIDGTFVTAVGESSDVEGVATQNYYPIAVLESQYSILEGLEETVMSAYSILERIERTLGAGYGIVGRLARTITSGYGIIGRIAATIASQYGIVGRLARTITSRYDVRSLLGIIRSFGSTFMLEARREYTVSSEYGIINNVMRTIQSGYDILALAERTILSGYDIKGLLDIARSFASSFTLTARRSRTIQSGYGITGRIMGAFTSGYRIVERISANIPSTYNIRGLLDLARSFASSFNLETRRETTQISQYSIKGRIMAAVPSRYDVLNSVSITVQSGYDILGRVMGTITSGYDVLKSRTAVISSGYGIIGRALRTIASRFKIIGEREHTNRDTAELVNPFITLEAELVNPIIILDASLVNPNIVLEADITQ